MTDAQAYGSLSIEEQTYKLPASIRPERYQLRLTPELNAFTFVGEETGDIEVLQPTTEIVLNAAELQIHSVAVVTRNGQAITGAVILDEINERATLTFPERLAPGPYEL